MKILILIMGALAVAAVSIAIAYSVNFMLLAPLLSLPGGIFWGFWWADNADRYMS